MQIIELLMLLPFWCVFLITVALALLSVEAGLWLGKYQAQGSEAAKQVALSDLVRATSGLLVFMLAFTFSLAASRFDARRTAVLDEANAIGTTYLRAGLLPDPYRAETRRLLRQYVEVRLKAVQSGKIQEAIAPAEDIQARLWAEAEAAGGKNSGSIVAGLFISSLNDVIDLHAKRVMLGLRNRIPTSIWAALFFLEVCALGMMGYHSGLKGVPRLPAILPMALSFSVVLLLIVDLDRPQEGSLKVSQEPLTDLLENFDRRGP